MMTKRERLGKEQIVKALAKDGYVTYSNLFELFDLHLTKDPEVIGYMVPEEAVICVNENLDLDQVGVIVRHEILHEFLNHHKRAQAHDPKGNHDTFNIAGDYEISNLGYTDKDKSAVRAIRLGDQVLKGLVTDYDHPDWIDKNFEEMYDLLKKLQKEDPNAQKQPQIGNRGNKQIQDAEDAQRRAEQISEAAGDMAQEGGSPGQGGEKKGQKGQGSGGGEDGQGKDSDPKTGSGGSKGDDKKKRNKYDDEEYANMSPEEKKKERARRRKEAAKKLKEEADKLIDEIKDTLNDAKGQGGSGNSEGNSTGGGPGSNSGEVFDTPEEQRERSQRIAKIKELLGNLEKGQQALDESRSAVMSERAAKAARDAHRYRDNALTRFTESLNKFIRNAIARSRNSSWAHINKKYVNSGLLRPGTSMSARGKVPLINVYFDRSGSWDASKTDKGRQAISTLNKYITRGEIKMNLYYFNTQILDKDPGGNGGTNGQPILDHIEQTKPDNVIVLTDSDISDCRTKTEVPGAVWLMWYGGRSDNLATHLSGRQLTKEFRIE